MHNPCFLLKFAEIINDLTMKSLSKYIMSVAGASILFSCNNKPEWKVDGRIEGADGQTMYVEASDNGRWYVLDSVELKGAGDFTVTAPASGYPDIYRLRLGDKSLYFPIDSIETVTVVSKAGAFDSDYTISGTDTAEKLMAVEKKLMDAVSKEGVQGVASDSILKRELSNLLLENPSGIVSYYIINKKISGVPVFNPENKSDLRLIGAVANAFDIKRPTDPRTNYLKNLYISNRRAYSRPDTLVAPETSLIEVNLYDLKGKKHSLTEVASKNRVVLLNFTAYGDEYSPALNIELNKIYNKYHANGLEIYQIGFDGNEVSWRNTARNLPWVTVYNSDADGPFILRSYNIGALPATYLISNGEIRERVNETNLDQAVAKYM